MFCLIKVLLIIGFNFKCHLLFNKYLNDSKVFNFKSHLLFMSLNNHSINRFLFNKNLTDSKVFNFFNSQVSFNKYLVE